MWFYDFISTADIKGRAQSNLHTTVGASAGSSAGITGEAEVWALLLFALLHNLFKLECTNFCKIYIFHITQVGRLCSHAVMRATRMSVGDSRHVHITRVQYFYGNLGQLTDQCFPHF